MCITQQFKENNSTYSYSCSWCLDCYKNEIKCYRVIDTDTDNKQHRTSYGMIHMQTSTETNNDRLTAFDPGQPG